jgi:DNA-directed RNA polymerase specialized sigma24 family protein
MTEHHPNHSAYRRARSGELSFPVDRERALRARQEAEALFAPKPQPRVAEKAASPTAPRASDPLAAGDALPQPVRQIPADHAARIRTWLRYGMSIAEVATVYGVQVGEIERFLQRA